MCGLIYLASVVYLAKPRVMRTGDSAVTMCIPAKVICVEKLIVQSIVIENLSHGFTRPNILDVKLGTVLHEPSASDEKKARMEKQAKETTTREHGIRLTGFQVSFGLLPRIPFDVVQDVAVASKLIVDMARPFVQLHCDPQIIRKIDQGRSVARGDAAVLPSSGRCAG